jgi:hypothetical protein
MRVLICGDRNWTACESIVTALASLHEREGVTCVIEGEARGADVQGRLAAEGLGIPVERYPANWHKYGRAAGPIRNQEMLARGKPDLVMAFHADLAHSKGTKDMVNRARKAGLPVQLYEQ